MERQADRPFIFVPLGIRVPEMLVFQIWFVLFQEHVDLCILVKLQEMPLSRSPRMARELDVEPSIHCRHPFALPIGIRFSAT